MYDYSSILPGFSAWGHPPRRPSLLSLLPRLTEVGSVSPLGQRQAYLTPISVPSTDRLGSLKSDPLTDREDLRQERSIDLSALMG